MFSAVFELQSHKHRFINKLALAALALSGSCVGVSARAQSEARGYLEFGIKSDSRDAKYDSALSFKRSDSDIYVGQASSTHKVPKSSLELMIADASSLEKDPNSNSYPDVVRVILPKVTGVDHGRDRDFQIVGMSLRQHVVRNFYIVDRDIPMVFQSAKIREVQNNPDNIELRLARYDYLYFRSGLNRYPPRDEFQTKVLIGYARALHHACIQLNYITCNAAIDSYTTLKDGKDLKPEWIGEPLSKIDEYIKTLTVKVNRQPYEILYFQQREFERQTSAGNTVAAAEAGEKLIKLYYVLGEIKKVDANDQYVVNLNGSLAKLWGDAAKTIPNDKKTQELYFDKAIANAQAANRPFDIKYLNSLKEKIPN